MNNTRPKRERNLVDWDRPHLNGKRRLLHIIDISLEGHYSMKGAQKSCSLAYHFLNQNPKERPLMSDVVETLEPPQNSKDMVNASLVYTLNNGIASYKIHNHLKENFSNINGYHVHHNNSLAPRDGPTVCRVR